MNNEKFCVQEVQLAVATDVVKIAPVLHKNRNCNQPAVKKLMLFTILICTFGEGVCKIMNKLNDPKTTKQMQNSASNDAK